MSLILSLLLALERSLIYADKALLLSWVTLGELSALFQFWGQTGIITNTVIATVVLCTLVK